MHLHTFAFMTTARRLLSFTLLLSMPALANWQPLSSGLGSVRSITTQGTAIYAASYPNGVFRSVNEGANWSPVNNGLPVSGTSIFARSVGRNTTHLFAGTHSGIYRSANGGDSWELANGSLTASAQVYANKFFQYGNTTFAVFTGAISAGGGIHRTVDNGNTWLIGHSGMGSNATVYHIATSGTALYAATSVGLYKSTDNGQQWTALSGANFAVYAVQWAMDRLHVISAFGYRYSTNDGGNWTNATGAISNPTRGELIAYDGKLFAITGTNTGVLRSVDNGASYSAYNDGLAPIDAVSQEQFHATATRLFMGTFGDIYSVASSTVDVQALEHPVPAVAHPSPFQQAFTVNMEGYPGPIMVELMDATGRSVQQLRTERVPVEVPRNSMPAGAYIVQLRTMDGRLLDRLRVIAE